MNSDVFFENLELLADAPNGMQKLRELILQLAVMGKLMPQDSNDEPANILIEKVYLENEKLAKEKRIRVSKLFPPLEEDEIPFKAPNNWEWVKLGNICYQITDGTHHTPTYLEEGVPFLSVKDVSSGTLDFSNTRFISEKEHKELTKRCNPEYEDLLLTKVGTTGIAKVIDVNINFSIFVSLALLKFPKDLIYPYFLELMINSPFVKNQSSSNTQGIGNKNLVLKYINNFDIVLPPLTEQKRIVSKVNQLMSLCDKLEARRQRKQALQSKLNSAALGRMLNAENQEEFEQHWQRICENFDLLYDNPENVEKLRQAILQLAVQGKLVEQNPEDEPASVLIEKIEAEKKKLVKGGKIQKFSPLPVVDTIEIPYEVPTNWEWIRFGKIIESMMNGIYKHAKYYSDDGIGCLRMYNINGGEINLKDLKRMMLTEEELKNYQLLSGDLLVNRVNSRELVGKAGVIRDFGEPLVFESKNIRVRFLMKETLPDYINILFQTREIRKTFEGDAKQTCGQASVNQVQIENLLIPLPPLAEQKRIVEKIEQLMGLCDELESKLRKSREDSEKLMEAVVKGLLEGAATEKTELEKPIPLQVASIQLK